MLLITLKITVYDYMLGQAGDNLDGGSDTYGIALTGKLKVGDIGLSYRAEYAEQDDPTLEDSGTNNSDTDVDADYYNIALNANMSGFLVGAGYEVLSGDSDTGDSKIKSFKTPYATLHAHNGWADVFLGNGGQGAGNNAGLEDMSVMAGYKAKGFGLFKVVYHDFQSETGSTDFGTEFDVIYKNKIPGVKGLSGMLKFAEYDADDYGTDTTKFWAMLDYKFSTK